MPKFSFTAKSQKGDPHSGVLEAKDERDLAAALHREGYVLISAEVEEQKKLRSFSLGSLLPFLDQVSSKEKMIFTRNLKVMIGAGVSLPRALNTMAKQTESPKFKKVLSQIESEIIKGRSFSEAVCGQSNVFSDLFCSMIKVGEEAGTLEENLAILAGQMEREQDMKSKIQSAMVYPAVIILTMMGIGIMMLVMVVPKLADTFEELGVDLPLTTKIVIFMGKFFSEKWYLAIIILAVFILSVRFILKTKLGAKLFSSLSLKIPVISQIVKKTNSAQTVRNLSSLTAAGIPLLRSLEIISNTLGNVYYRKALSEAIEVVRKGGKLSDALKNYQDLYSLTVIQMIEVGEETGETSGVLGKLGDFFEEEVAAATKNLIAIIEPFLMLIVGGAVGFFAISMIQPMYSMLQGLE